MGQDKIIDWFMKQDNNIWFSASDIVKAIDGHCKTYKQLMRLTILNVLEIKIAVNPLRYLYKIALHRKRGIICSTKN